jgi:hypothetical protein
LHISGGSENPNERKADLIGAIFSFKASLITDQKACKSEGLKGSILFDSRSLK